MTDYQGNSHKSKNEVPPEFVPRKVVQGKVVKQKTPLGRKIKEMFFVADSKTVGNYIFWEVITPRLKNLLYETWTLGVGRALYGGSPQQNQMQQQAQQSVRVNYQQASSVPRPVNPYTGGFATAPQPAPVVLSGPRVGHEYLFGTRNDAESVLEMMMEALMVHGVVTMADVDQMVGLPIPHTDHKLGWTHLGHARIEQSRNGFVLKLPPVITV
jgi:hypothetical protein